MRNDATQYAGELTGLPVIEQYQTVWIGLGASARDESTLPDFGFIAISVHAGSVE
jgi:hypothetical protein